MQNEFLVGTLAYRLQNTAKVGMGIMLEANAAPYDEEMMASLPPQL